MLTIKIISFWEPIDHETNYKVNIFEGNLARYYGPVFIHKGDANNYADGLSTAIRLLTGISPRIKYIKAKPTYSYRGEE